MTSMERAPQSQQNGMARQQQHAPHDSGMSVGSSTTTSTSADAERIHELEDEVRMLAEKANAASQRYADYENEIRVLEAKLRQEQRKNSVAADPSANAATIAAVAVAATTAAAPASRPGISRFNSFMSTRKATPPLLANGSGSSTSTATSPVDRQKELEEQLVKEQTARIAAEQKAQAVSAEIEDLSATLFQQANEMVATERKQNSALQEKVQALERSRSIDEYNRSEAGAAAIAAAGNAKSDMAAVALQNENARLREKLKTMEVREAQRVKRLERLEAATKRVERVRAMLKPP